VCTEREDAVEREGNVPCHIKSRKKDDILFIEARGKRSLQAVLDITEHAFNACKEHGIKKAIVDIQKLEGKLSTLDAYEIPATHYDQYRDRSILEKAAIIDSKEHVQSYTFFENVAVNRGYQIRFFNYVKDALEWLK